MLQIQALGLRLRELSNACQCQQILLLVLHERRRSILEIWEALFFWRFLRLSVRSVRLVRGLGSAHNSHNAWDLRCALREGILVWLAEHHPYALPTTRLLEAAEDPAARRPTAPPAPPMRSPGPDDVPNPDPARTGEWPVVDR